QDTGIIQAITEAPQSASYAAMAARQQALAVEILKDPDVDSLSSFIGVDGTNSTLNRSRSPAWAILTTRWSRTTAAVMERLKQRTDSLPGITLYMQPVQDLTVEGIVSRMQYQFVLQASDAAQ
ncbi:efflux RND transporter permease subunit, partial [Lysobacter sp. TAB13]|uniref:efflux RND transporter permease subunit n=1 Tax=Lysobacter sp. TAB13 TaxID=3233065 RepID=UPI003F94F40F